MGRFLIDFEVANNDDLALVRRREVVPRDSRGALFEIE